MVTGFWGDNPLFDFYCHETPSLGLCGVGVLFDCVAEGRTTVPNLYRVTIHQGTKKLGVPVLPVRLEMSEARFKLELVNDLSRICLPFNAIEGVGEIVARVVVPGR